ncbi:MAG TPA: hypothetical protein VNY75_07380 [Rhizomicrobium sp.]|jgi:hypothetical protein|nr:hypothetical protein [Rhizomicrobium sp.]
MRIYFSALIVAAVMAPAAPAGAQMPVAAAGSNMLPDFYPHPACVKPDTKGLGGAPGVQDQEAMRAYNYKVKRFNDEAAAFNACIKTYIDNAQNDINAIQGIVHAAVADANTR